MVFIILSPILIDLHFLNYLTAAAAYLDHTPVAAGLVDRLAVPLLLLAEARQQAGLPLPQEPHTAAELPEPGVRPPVAEQGPSPVLVELVPVPVPEAVLSRVPQSASRRAELARKPEPCPVLQLPEPCRSLRLSAPRIRTA